MTDAHDRDLQVGDKVEYYTRPYSEGHQDVGVITRVIDDGNSYMILPSDLGFDEHGPLLTEFEE